MLHASRDWKRNKWWLFDRVVESPHRTSFFVRRDISQAGGDSDLKEEAKYWYVLCFRACLRVEDNYGPNLFQVQRMSDRSPFSLSFTNGGSMRDYRTSRQRRDA